MMLEELKEQIRLFDAGCITERELQNAIFQTYLTMEVELGIIMLEAYVQPLDD